MSPATTELLALEGLGWSVGGRRILGPIDLQLEAGECLAVVGPNGAGKTTLLRLVTGLLEPTVGRIRWRGAGLDSLSRRELARRIAYVPQSRPSRIPFSVEQLVMLGRYPYLSGLQWAPRKRDFEAVSRALEQVGLTGLRRRRLDALSGGERQAAFIAAALAQEAELLVLDEPTTHLDPSHQREIATLIRRFNRELDRTVLTATHDLNFASLIADRVAGLRAGELIACDAPGRLLEPALLAELFEAPFQVVRGGERPITVLDLE